MTALRVQTDRLELIASTAELARAELRNRAEFVRLLAARVPDEWPPELSNDRTIAFNLRQLERSPAQAGWWCWYFVRCDEGIANRVLVGNGGFKGRPNKQGVVEVGYSILEEFQCRGYCTEAVAGLIRWAFGHKKVEAVIAETLPLLAPSIRVLEKLGFANVGTGAEEGTIRFELRRVPFEKQQD